VNGEVVISAHDVYKDYGHVKALRGASLDVHRGEIVALVGDNGAGKSTLLKTMCGAIQPDAGEIRILGRPVELVHVRTAHELGVQTVYQDLALAPDLDVTSNIFLGTELVRPGVLGRMGWLSRRAMGAEARQALLEFGVQIPSLDVPVSDLSGGQRQAVAIARAVRTAENAILLDEPTAALGTRQTEIVLETVRTVAARGLGVLVISHDMPRMLPLAHRIVVLRHGAVVASLASADATIPRIVALMLGASAESVDAVL
jgi:ABC-type sugar transport system ATPase subunit